MQDDENLDSRGQTTGKNPGEQPAEDKGEPGLLSVCLFTGVLGAICCLVVPLLATVGSAGVVASSFDAAAPLKPYLWASAGALALLGVLYAAYRWRRRSSGACASNEGRGPQRAGAKPTP